MRRTRSLQQASHTDQGGFTLIEILVVVSLLTLLALIAIPNYLSAQKEAQKSSCINNIKEISYAMEQWALEKKKTATADVNFSDISPFLKGSVVCPAGGKSFDDSYVITIVANEPTCQRQPQKHYWLGSTAIAAIQTDPGKAGGASSGLTGGGGNDNGNGKGGGKGKGKPKGP